MIRISKEKIGGNIHTDNDAPDINEDIGEICCSDDECQLPDWAADE